MQTNTPGSRVVGEPTLRKSQLALLSSSARVPQASQGWLWVYQGVGQLHTGTPILCSERNELRIAATRFMRESAGNAVCLWDMRYPAAFSYNPSNNRDSSSQHAQLNMKLAHVVVKFTSSLSSTGTGTLSQIWLPSISEDGSVVLGTQVNECTAEMELPGDPLTFQFLFGISEDGLCSLFLL